MNGPTKFQKIIKGAAKKAREFKKALDDVQAYLILLILTDGEINDLGAAKLEVIKASRLPLSIVIIGVGDAEFAKMDELDSDDSELTAGGRKAKRDSVQFVPFREFKDRPMAELAAAVLEEIPTQFLEFMTENGVKPSPPPTETEMVDLQAAKLKTQEALAKKYGAHLNSGQ